MPDLKQQFTRFPFLFVSNFSEISPFFLAAPPLNCTNPNQSLMLTYDPHCLILVTFSNSNMSGFKTSYFPPYLYQTSAWRESLFLFVHLFCCFFCVCLLARTFTLESPIVHSCSVSDLEDIDKIRPKFHCMSGTLLSTLQRNQ